MKNKIRAIRELNKLNQKEFGQKLGVKRTTITEYEAGRIQPSVKVIQAMSKVFNVSIEYLMGE